MDRHDEKKAVTDETVDREERTGDVLGLGGITAPKAPGDPSAREERESGSHRPAGLEPTAGSDPVDPSSQGGATGIDMGGGGQGTLLRRPRSGGA